MAPRKRLSPRYRDRGLAARESPSRETVHGTVPETQPPGPTDPLDSLQIGVIISTVKQGKMKPREGKQPAYGHPAHQAGTELDLIPHPGL